MDTGNLKKGRFYGVSVGPGDPELLTLKAVRCLERCPVLAAPQTASGRMLALDIARGAADLRGKTILPLHFVMSREEEALRASHQEAAEKVRACLDAGQDVAMLNLGDVSVYATYGYLEEILKEQGYETYRIAGVPSFCAAAARLGRSLTEMDLPVHIVPAGGFPLEEALDLPGTKVLMKSGRALPQVLEALESRGLLESSAMVQNCGLPGEQAAESLKDAPQSGSYFTTLLVP